MPHDMAHTIIVLSKLDRWLIILLIMSNAERDTVLGKQYVAIMNIRRIKQTMFLTTIHLWQQTLTTSSMCMDVIFLVSD